jgi:AmiR/NasT family two-component response regulator
MPHPLRIVSAYDLPEDRDLFKELVPLAGHELVGLAGDRGQLVELCRSTLPDLVLADVRVGIEAAAGVSVPIVLVSAHHDTELLRRVEGSPAMGYLLKPLTVERLRAAVHVAAVRFGRLAAVQREADRLRQELEDRKVVERAKGVVMRRLGIDEPEAYRRLQRLAANRNQKLADLARAVLEAEEVFHAMESLPHGGGP